MPYRLGADGTAGEIDCIHLCYEALGAMDIPTPVFDQRWYCASTREVLRALRGWGKQIQHPTYDGDIHLRPDPVSGWAFAVTWQKGALYIDRHRNQVSWLPLHHFNGARYYRCCHLSAI